MPFYSDWRENLLGVVEVGSGDGEAAADQNNKIRLPVRDRDDKILVDNIFAPGKQKRSKFLCISQRRC